METYTKSFPIAFAPVADERATVLGPCVRFSVLTGQLVRMEYSPSSIFEDRASQVFWYREQPVPEFDVRRGDGSIEIETEHLHLRYESINGGFGARSLSIQLKESGDSWQYGQDDPLNLKGTGRTLDDIDGAMELENGLVSRSGWSVWDDSEQLLFNEEGWLTPRDGEEGYKDLYFFGFGQDYYGCLRAFSQVAGSTPMLPRWALGNWWSRYWAYSSDELLALMDEFKDRQVPLSVCIVDMDWHIVDTGNDSSGWTGYTWNRELFPDPQAFIDALHERGMKTALNLHPAEGIHAHEDQYGRMAEAVGIDPLSKEPVSFAIDNTQFARAYFEELHHPYEKQGIDFWWLDWQQGTLSGLPGLDPLWWLNHLHFYDLARNGDKRPFIFSRWGGLGNHRYPIGFSGDTHVTWESLAFQPYLTATAANVNFGWWSHDIGGHMSGVEDAELFARWVQYGVFSPILRLHSTNNPYHERRPWGYDAETERVAVNALRLRHRMIPYLQSMARRDHLDSIPLVRPMYYDYPQDEQAYHCPDQYLFGSELLAAPYITPADGDTRLSRQVIWFPEGIWFDFFHGDQFDGSGWHAVYGGLDDIPVFAKAGSVVPMSSERDDGTESFELHFFPGDSAAFELTSRDDDPLDLIEISQQWSDKAWTIFIEPTSAQVVGGINEKRTFEILFRNVQPDLKIAAEIDGKACEIGWQYDTQRQSVQLSPIQLKGTQKVIVMVTTTEKTIIAANNAKLSRGQNMLRAFRMNTNLKLKLASDLPRILEDPELLSSFQLALTSNQLRALSELATGIGVHRTESRDGKNDVIILWNNGHSDKVNWIFVADDGNGLAHSEIGSLPQFGVVTLRENGLTFHSGSQPAEGRISVNRWFDLLTSQISREKIEDTEAIIQFDISGNNGCQQFLELKQGDALLCSGIHERPNVTITAPDEAWMGLINGDKTPEELFLSGNLQIGGNFELIAGLVDAFSFSPPGVYVGDNWRIEVNYMDALVLRLGKD